MRRKTNENGSGYIMNNIGVDTIIENGVSTNPVPQTALMQATGEQDWPMYLKRYFVHEVAFGYQSEFERGCETYERSGQARSTNCIS
jgi:hypothetical protein